MATSEREGQRPADAYWIMAALLPAAYHHQVPGDDWHTVRVTGQDNRPTEWAIPIGLVNPVELALRRASGVVRQWTGPPHRRAA